jgi:hypothetical protein
MRIARNMLNVGRGFSPNGVNLELLRRLQVAGWIEVYVELWDRGSDTEAVS